MFQPITPSSEEVAAICSLVKKNLGIKLHESNIPLIMSRLGKRILQLEIPSYRQYLDLVISNPDEMVLFINFFTTNVTQFFRESYQLTYMVHNVLPEVIQTKKEPIIRCWSAGCASGEEAYTIGMLITENLTPDWTVNILASDICTSALQEGADGRYTAEQIENIPSQSLINKYFKKIDNSYQVKEFLRKRVFFRNINLISESVLPTNIKLDFIFCRNVLIYFDKELQNQIISHFYRHLNKGGYLFLGHAEKIDTNIDRRWKVLKNAIYQKNED